jgi:acyl-coenzyme A thioesterase PaaI-like protein
LKFEAFEVDSIQMSSQAQGGAQSEDYDLEDGWQVVEPFPRLPTQNSFVSGNPSSKAIQVQYYRHEPTQAFRARAWFGPLAEGPPGHAHGGSQAALLDEVMGALAWNQGYQVVAAKLEINFRKPLPLLSQVEVCARLTEIKDRKIFVEADLRMLDPQQTLISEGKGLFIQIDPTKYTNPSR